MVPFQLYLDSDSHFVFKDPNGVLFFEEPLFFKYMEREYASVEDKTFNFSARDLPIFTKEKIQIWIW